MPDAAALDTGELRALPGIGPRLEGALRAAGITDAETLRRTGAVEAWRAVHPHFTCFHSLLALEAAIQGLPKRELDDATRDRLRREAGDD